MKFWHNKSKIYITYLKPEYIKFGISYITVIKLQASSILWIALYLTYLVSASLFSNPSSPPSSLFCISDQATPVDPFCIPSNTDLSHVSLAPSSFNELHRSCLNGTQRFHLQYPLSLRYPFIMDVLTFISSLDSLNPLMSQVHWLFIRFALNVIEDLYAWRKFLLLAQFRRITFAHRTALPTTVR